MKKGNFRKRKFNRKRKNTYKIFFLVIIGMTLGFAAINTTLQLIGTLNISRTTWNIHWENPTKVGGVNATQDVHLKTGDNTTVEYQVNLANPGDYYEFTVDAKNEGTIDAMVTGFTNKVYENNVEITKPDYLDFIVTYSDDKQIANNHLLASTKSETYKVKVMYKTGLTADQLPTSTSTYKFTFSVTYMQADNNATPVRYQAYTLGEIVYFDPVTDNPCNSDTFSLTNINNGTSTCYKWRVMTPIDNDTNSSIKLQLDHNLVNKTRWSTQSTSSTGPDKVLSELATATSTWTKLPLLNYTYDTTLASPNDYGVLTCTDGTCTITGKDTPIATNMRVRLITGEEMRDITRTEVPTLNWTLATSSAASYYFFSEYDYELGTHHSGSGNENLAWLLENVSSYKSGATNNVYGDNTCGYWSLSPSFDSSAYVWEVNIEGYYSNVDVDREPTAQYTYGARPFIEIPKSYLG